MSGLLSTTAKVAATSGLIINLFAGGGGTAIGIKAGMGRAPNINVNHARDAIAMHSANHPDALHFEQDVWGVDPVAATNGEPVDLLWLSPDCRHFSKAKGAKPVSKKIRGLANVGIKWAKAVEIRQGMLLENVEEFETWGPLIATEKGMMPCPERKGVYFRRWVKSLYAAGATDIQWRTLRACDYGAPTIRKRLFLIARFDGDAIVWPAPTHAHRDSKDVQEGRLLPFKTAADCIDWSLPCPSIFLDKAQGRELGIKRPLEDATLKRVAHGTVRYVIEAAEAGKAFVVPLTHTKGGNTARPITEPLATITTAKGGEFALVKPTLMKVAHITKFRSNSVGTSLDEPMHTVTAQSTVGNPGGASIYGMVEATLERADLLAPHLMTMRNAQKPYQAADEPTHTITAEGAHQYVVQAELQKADRVAAFMAQHNAGFNKREGRPVDEPISGITQTGSQQQLVTAHLVKLRGTCTDGQPVTEPMPTLTAGGTHVGLVYAFLIKYYGQIASGQALTEPLHTATTGDRFGLVIVKVDGEDYVITDIGMRMLTPRELARAQGFPDSYILDPVCWYPTKSGKLKYGRLPVHSQISKIGNSVCPVMAEVLTAANFGPQAGRRRFKPLPPPRRAPQQYDLFAEAA